MVGSDYSHPSTMLFSEWRLPSIETNVLTNTHLLAFHYRTQHTDYLWFFQGGKIQVSPNVPMLGVVTKKCKIELTTPNTFKIILIQGLNRHIRRMCEHFGYEVIKLERIRIMNIGLKGLPIGDWRDLTESEMKMLYSMLEKSSATDKKSSSPSKTKQSASTKKQSENHGNTFRSGKSYGKNIGKRTARRGKR